jgi:hypothetical protein
MNPPDCQEDGGNLKRKQDQPYRGDQYSLRFVKITRPPYEKRQRAENYRPAQNRRAKRQKADTANRMSELLTYHQALLTASLKTFALIFLELFGLERFRIHVWASRDLLPIGILSRRVGQQKSRALLRAPGLRHHPAAHAARLAVTG